MTVIRPTFVVGQHVTWTSQAQGSTVTKLGEIHSIVPAGNTVHPVKYPSLAKGAGSPRDHESYVVRTYDNPAKQTGLKYYWPLVSKLIPVTAAKA